MKKKTKTKKKLTNPVVQSTVNSLLKSPVAHLIIKEVGEVAVKKALMASVKAIGTAGTGIAIGKLSGAAAHNAALAYLGFGSMFAGEIVLFLLTTAALYVLVKLAVALWEELAAA